MKFQLIVVPDLGTLEVVRVFTINDSLDLFKELLVNIIFLFFFGQFLLHFAKYLGLSLRVLIRLEIMVGDVVLAFAFMRNGCDLFRVFTFCAGSARRGVYDGFVKPG